MPLPRSIRPEQPALPFRRLRIYAFDPSASLDLQLAVVNEATVQLDGEMLAPGPIGEYVAVVDVDPSSGGFYAPIDLDEPALLVQNGTAPSEGNPKFHQQMVYAVAMTTIRNFERALGRKVLWAPRVELDEKQAYVQRLRIYPHALREANAYYSPERIALLFGYFRASQTNAGRNLPGGLVFTCLSHDVIAHETTHAILDGMHRRYIEASNVDMLAFHEGFADIVALFQHFTLADALRQQIEQTRGDLGKRSMLSGLARQFGEAIGHYGALRDAIDDVDADGMPDPTKLAETLEPHDRGAILVAAVFDAFVTIYRARIADLLRLVTGDGTRFPDGDLHPDLVGRLTAEAVKAAGHVLRICIRALDYLPPVDVTFGDYLRALITADHDLVTDDARGYRIAFIEAFRRRGIYPKGCRSLSIENLLWSPLETQIKFPNLWRRPFRYEESREKLFLDARRRAFELRNWILDNRDAFGETAARSLGLRLDADAPKTIRRRRDTRLPHVEVHSVRLADRIGPDGQREPQVIIEITQERRAYRTAELQAEMDDVGRRPGVRPDFTFRGGATLIVDARTHEIRYAIVKAIDSEARLAAERAFRFGGAAETLGATYFGASRQREPFAFLHRML